MEIIEELEVARGILTKVVDGDNTIYIITNNNSARNYSSIAVINKDNNKLDLNNWNDINYKDDKSDHFNYARDSIIIKEVIKSIHKTFTKEYLIIKCKHHLFNELYLAVLVDKVLEEMIKNDDLIQMAPVDPKINEVYYVKTDKGSETKNYEH